MCWMRTLNNCHAHTCFQIDDAQHTKECNVVCTEAKQRQIYTYTFKMNRLCSVRRLKTSVSLFGYMKSVYRETTNENEIKQNNTNDTHTVQIQKRVSTVCTTE